MRTLLRAALAALLLSAPAAAQDANITLPVDSIERLLGHEPFSLVAIEDTRWPGDRTQRAALRFRDGTVVGVKWARAAPGGWELNNQPRYELAAYRLQTLFLDPPDYVVPPTALRAVPLAVYRRLEPAAPATFEGVESVVVLIQYWLSQVSADGVLDPARLCRDSVYARHFADLNVLTYLIRHADENVGNVLVSTAGAGARVFAVDNGVAFASPDSPRGTRWSELLVDRLPAATVARLRALTEQRLRDALGVLAEFRVDAHGRLERVEPGAKRRWHLGVDYADGVVQFGLTEREVLGVHTRLRALLAKVDAGEITPF